MISQDPRPARPGTGPKPGTKKPAHGGCRAGSLSSHLCECELYTLFNDLCQEQNAYEANFFHTSPAKPGLARVFDSAPPRAPVPVPPLHRQENCIPSAAIRWPDLGHPGCRRMSAYDPGCVKLFFGDRDEILSREAGLRRNNDSSTLSSGCNYCAIGLGARVFTQPGPIAVVGPISRVTMASRIRHSSDPYRRGSISPDFWYCSWTHTKGR